MVFSLPFPLRVSSRPTYARSWSVNFQTIVGDKIPVRKSISESKVTSPRKCGSGLDLIKRRDAIWLVFEASNLFMNSFSCNGAGLPPEEKPRLCDDLCEKALENYKEIKVGVGPSPPIGFQVAANYVAMTPSGQIFDSSLERRQPNIFRVGSGQIIKGLDEGILSMKVGGKRRLYIPGHLAFPKGLISAPGRPRVAPNSPVIFDVSLEYIPGLEQDEEDERSITQT